MWSMWSVKKFYGLFVDVWNKGNMNWSNVLLISKAYFLANKNELNVTSEREIAKNSTSN